MSIFHCLQDYVMEPLKLMCCKASSSSLCFTCVFISSLTVFFISWPSSQSTGLKALKTSLSLSVPWDLTCLFTDILTSSLPSSSWLDFCTLFKWTASSFFFGRGGRETSAPSWKQYVPTAYQNASLHNSFLGPSSLPAASRVLHTEESTRHPVPE